MAPVPIEDQFKAHCPPCSNIMLIGEQRRFMSAIITFKVDINMATGQPSKNLLPDAQKYFKDKLGLSLKTTDEAVSNPKVVAHIQQCVNATNLKVVSKAAHIKKFELVATDFSLPGGELTPTMKLKRKVTEQKHKEVIEAMYAEQKPKL